jgi:hypothetical protein
MSTASFELAQSVPSRTSELLLLVTNAKAVAETDEIFYNALCRSACVLLASHLEGFLKDASKSIIRDLNYYLDNFSQMPTVMQREFCRRIAHYEGVANSEVNDRINQLIKFFSKNSVSIDMTAFSYKENPNKNPKPSVIELTFDRIGVPNILSAIATPTYEEAFSGGESELNNHIKNLMTITKILEEFPFKDVPAPYTPKWTGAKKKKDIQTIWHAFIEEIMNRRHSVAHGDTLSHDTSWEQLHLDILKMQMLMYGLLLSSATFICRDIVAID